MTDDGGPKLSETFFRDSEWIAFNGGWLHSNNVLFYFGASPFCDGQSTNVSIFQQSKDNPELAEKNLRDKRTFENRLKARPGIEYVVAHDPLESNVFVQGPSGPEQSRIWVIRKQRREKSGTEDTVIPLAFYYIQNDTIFQAPTAGDILNNRLLTTITSLTSMISATQNLDYFTPSRGHTYLPPMLKAAEKHHTGLSQRSKEPTPATNSQSQNTSHGAASDSQTSTVSSTKTLVEAIRMTMQHGKEYMDDSPLAGEPGNFRLSKLREALGPVSASSSQNARPTTASKTSSPAPIKAPSPLPPLQTDLPEGKSKKSAKPADGSPDTPGGHPKPKRRKSRVVSAIDQQL